MKRPIMIKSGKFSCNSANVIENIIAVWKNFTVGNIIHYFIYYEEILHITNKVLDFPS